MSRSTVSRAKKTVLAVAVLTLASCGADNGTSAVEESAATTVEDGAYPVSIEHAYGSTEFTAAPSRVVTLGWSGQDVVLALGTVPVGLEKFSGSGIENDILPWDAELLAGSTPTVLTSNPDVPFEQILALEPDAILAVYSGIGQEDYERLSDIAPTLAFPEERWATTLEDQTTMIGAALGQPARAQELLDGIDDYFDAQAAAHPQFDGRTMTFGMHTDEGMIVFCPTDTRISLLSRLGIESSPGVIAACSSGDSSVSVPGEQVDTLDADVVVLVDADGTVLDQAMAFEPFARLSAVRDGRLVRQVGMDYAMAISAPTVLSIPYAFDKFIGQIDEALQ